jgi:hypothetical protein
LERSRKADETITSPDKPEGEKHAYIADSLYLIEPVPELDLSKPAAAPKSKASSSHHSGHERKKRM